MHAFCFTCEQLEIGLSMNSLKPLFGISVLLLTACTVSMKDDAASADSGAAVATTTPAPTVAPSMPMPMDSMAMMDTTSAAANTRVEVDLKARKLYLFNGSDTSKTYSVAVGSQKWPTQTGDWRIRQVVWNPEWTPPDESWAEEREPRKPGDPKNPLGRVQLVYDPPRTIHGTNDRTSIGKAVSHGSIRMYNEQAAELGRTLMEAAGVGKDSAFYRNAERNKTEKVVVDLPQGIPIRVF
jgi:lipoprotein-anchoring transpeptidase ErfK/SrfK